MNQKYHLAAVFTDITLGYKYAVEHYTFPHAKYEISFKDFFYYYSLTTASLKFNNSYTAYK